MMDQSEYAIRILQWNAQGISTSKEDLLKLISECEPRVIQETFLAGDIKVKLGGFNCYSKQGSFNRRYHGGIATYLHNLIPAQEIKNCISISDRGSDGKCKKKSDNYHCQHLSSRKCSC